MADHPSSKVAEEPGAFRTLVVPRADGLPALIGILKKGLPFSSFEKLRMKLDVPAKTLAEILHIASRTLARRREDGRLHTDESERLYRLARLVELAEDFIGEENGARKWFTTPKRALGGTSPLEFADTEPGAREVEDLIHRLEHGVFT